VIQGKSETLGPCDEASAIGALVHEKPWLEVACDIWNLDWGLGLSRKVLPGKKNSKIVNQVANPSNYFFVSLFVVGQMGKRKAGLGQRSPVPTWH
jgi:hypothetical protein